MIFDARKPFAGGLLIVSVDQGDFEAAIEKSQTAIEVARKLVPTPPFVFTNATTQLMRRCDLICATVRSSSALSGMDRKMHRTAC